MSRRKENNDAVLYIQSKLNWKTNFFSPSTKFESPRSSKGEAKIGRDAWVQTRKNKCIHFNFYATAKHKENALATPIPFHRKVSLS